MITDNLNMEGIIMKPITIKTVTKEYTVPQGDTSLNYSETMTLFTLTGPNTTYAFAALESGHLAHIYYGKRTDDDDLSYLLGLDDYPYTPKVLNRDRVTFLDKIPLEYPCHGIGDYRESVIMLMDKAGMSSLDLRYESYEIIPGKPALHQELEDTSIRLPATFAQNEDAQTLAVTLTDQRSGLKAILYYSVFSQLDVITRSTRLVNTGADAFDIRRALSCAVDFDTDQYDFITLNGAWGRERAIERCRLHQGKQGVDSRRGTSSHQNNPFVALVSQNTDEDIGEAFGFHFVYSGNFFAQAECQYQKTRLVMGINPYDFSWTLKPGNEFTTPEVAMVYSSHGIGAMSRIYHDLYRKHLIRSKYNDIHRPILINNWEATYFDFNTEKLIDIARQASKLGIEMLVMDDGWFGHRDNDNSSLGDWFVYEEKLKGGLKNLVEQVNQLGMKFGIWFEPEMISPDSELFKEHPDWAIQIADMSMTMSREQYVLDYSRKEVREHIYAKMKQILDSANIEYIKWDMNRQLTEVGSGALPAGQQRELWHRYVLGVYDIMEQLTSDYPDILLENCSGGGGRFDPGMLFYSPQIWCSDDADAIERLKIQHGTSICYPVSSMGAHVSDCPNHTVGRNTPFSTRGNVAMAGTFGYELDVTKISEEERQQIPEQIQLFKKYSPIMRNGDQYRIGNMFEDTTWDAWMFVSKDKAEAVFSYVQVLAKPNTPPHIVKLKGLNPKKKYLNNKTGEIHSGAALMNCGIKINLHGDFTSTVIEFTMID